MYGFCAGLHSASDAEATSKDLLSYNGRVIFFLLPANFFTNIGFLGKSRDTHRPKRPRFTKRRCNGIPCPPLIPSQY